MEMEKIQVYQEKLRRLTSQRERKIRYCQHLEHRQQRLERIGQLIECSPDEAEELLNLMLEYWRSEGMIKKGIVRLPKITNKTNS